MSRPRPLGDALARPLRGARHHAVVLVHEEDLEVAAAPVDVEIAPRARRELGGGRRAPGGRRARPGGAFFAVGGRVRGGRGRVARRAPSGGRGEVRAARRSAARTRPRQRSARERRRPRRSARRDAHGASEAMTSSRSSTGHLKRQMMRSSAGPGRKPPEGRRAFLVLARRGTRHVSPS